MENFSEAFLRRKQVEFLTGLGRSAIYKLMTRDQFPKAIKLTEKAVGWQKSAIDAWILSRINATKDAR
jgi:prophage regulatory protein